LIRSRAALQLEILVLRHQLHILERSRPRRVPLTFVDPSAVGLDLADLARLAKRVA